MYFDCTPVTHPLAYGFPKKKQKIFFFFFLGGGGEIHKINLGRTCFNRVGRESETNNIFFRLFHLLSGLNE